MLVLGLGLGLVMQVLVLAVQNAVALRAARRRDLGATLFRSIGGSLGVSVFGAIFANRLATELAEDQPRNIAFTDSMHTVFLIAAVGGRGRLRARLVLPSAPLRRTIETSEGVGEAFARRRSSRVGARALAPARARRRARSKPRLHRADGRPRRGRARPARLLDARPSRRRHDRRRRSRSRPGPRDGRRIAAAVAGLRAAGYVTDDTGAPPSPRAAGGARPAAGRVADELGRWWPTGSRTDDPKLTPADRAARGELATDPEPARA